MLNPKEITLTSNVNGEKESRTYNIGRYDGFSGLELIGHAAELLDSAARKKAMSDDGVFAKKLQNMLKMQGKYIELVTENGTASLDTVAMLKASIPDPDIALQLMRAVHDYNTSLFSTANLYQKSMSMMETAKKLGTQIYQELQRSLLAKKQPRSKS